MTITKRLAEQLIIFNQENCDGKLSCNDLDDALANTKSGRELIPWLLLVLADAELLEDQDYETFAEILNRYTDEFKAAWPDLP